MDHEAHEAHEWVGSLSPHIERVAKIVVDAGFRVHRALGPGLLESTYEHCLAHALTQMGVAVRRQVGLPIVFEGLTLDAGYRLDLLVEEVVVVEVKAVEALTRLHWAQLHTYLKLSGHSLGFLMNFNVPMFRQGLKRLVY
ncbi:MAG TPA: GxxExxY protein [Caulobacteraceae bacterium]|nr:GxxExxY protein [Caulobacteraceae bacterium]